MLIDVRTSAEYAEGHIQNAMNIPLGDIATGNLGALQDVAKGESLQLYCRSGARSQSAQGLLQKIGFTNVVNLGSLEEAMRALEP